ncbi:MAG: hypothetical protein AB1715_08035 [Acidobacteriota bacterium]
MKNTKRAVFLLFAFAAAFGQTVDLGQHVFFNNEGEIVMAIDAALAVRKLDSPYLMFMVYLASSGSQNYSVKREDIIMIYKGQEFKMPSLEELRKEYTGANNDLNLYSRLGKDALAQSQFRFCSRFAENDFFPVLGRGAQIAAEQVSMSGSTCARTKMYFQNPGFQEGDEIIIKVQDSKNPEIVGFCAVVLDPK